MGPPSRGDCLWIVSEDEEFGERVKAEIEEHRCRWRWVLREPLDTLAFWKERPRYPGVVLLDTSGRLDWATRVLRAMKRARVPSPVIVVTDNPTQEFGTKIVSLGVSYFLPRDFASGELAQVFLSLVKPRGRQSGSEITGTNLN